jgi:hypothetical protein
MTRQVNYAYKRDEWLVDCGATHHTTPCLEILDEFSTYSGRVDVADGGSVLIKRKESTLLRITSHCGGMDMRLSNVLYISDLKSNLLSVNQLEKHSLKIWFDNGKVEIIDKETEKMLFCENKCRGLHNVTTLNISCNQMISETHLSEADDLLREEEEQKMAEDKDMEREKKENLEINHKKREEEEKLKNVGCHNSSTGEKSDKVDSHSLKSTS